MKLSGISYDSSTKTLTAVTEKSKVVGVNERAIAQILRDEDYERKDHLYFEVEILKSLDSKPLLAIGFAKDGHCNGMTGWRDLSIGFHCDDGLVFDSNPNGKYGTLLRKSVVGDVVGALWCKNSGIIIFSRNQHFFTEHLFFRSHIGECSDFLPTITCQYNRRLELRLRIGDDCKMPERNILTVLRTIIPKNRILVHQSYLTEVSFYVSSKFDRNDNRHDKVNQSMIQVVGETCREFGGIHYFEILIRRAKTGVKKVVMIKEETEKDVLRNVKKNIFYPRIFVGFAMKVRNPDEVMKGYSVGIRMNDGSLCYGGNILKKKIGFHATEGDILGVIWDRKETGLMQFFLNGQHVMNKNIYIPPHRSNRHFHNFLPTVTYYSGGEFQLFMGNEKCQFKKEELQKRVDQLRLERFRCGPGVRLSKLDIFDADLDPNYDYDSDENEDEEEEEEQKEKEERSVDRACIQIIGDTTDVKGMQYFEVEIIDCGRDLNPVIGIGYSKLGYKNGMVGWKDFSVGFHADDGCIFDSDGNPKVETKRKFTTGGIFGAIWDEMNGFIRFTYLCSSDKKREEKEDEEEEGEEGFNNGRRNNNMKILHEFVLPRRRVDHPSFVPTVTLRWGRGIRFKILLGNDQTELKGKDLSELRKRK